MARAIAVGVDGSPESLAAADWAAREATLRGLPVRIVHAWLWQPLDVPVVQDREALSQSANAVVREAETHVAARYPDLSMSAEVVPDTAVAALLGADEQAEMLVLGSRGHGALVGFMLGSYGQQVIAAATRPVVSVRAQAGDAGEPEGAEIVVGQQGGAEYSDAVLGFAFEAAAVRGRPCERCGPGVCRPSSPTALVRCALPTRQEGWNRSRRRHWSRHSPPGASGFRTCR